MSESKQPMSKFNELTPAEHERLALLAEELSEAISAVGKILRHGYESFNPDNLEAGNNGRQLADELGDVSYALKLMLRAGDVDEEQIVASAYAAANKKPQYLHHQSHGLVKWAREHFKSDPSELADDLRERDLDVIAMSHEITRLRAELEAARSKLTASQAECERLSDLLRIMVNPLLDEGRDEGLRKKEGPSLEAIEQAFFGSDDD